MKNTMHGVSGNRRSSIGAPFAGKRNDICVRGCGGRISSYGRTARARASFHRMMLSLHPGWVHVSAEHGMGHVDKNRMIAAATNGREVGDIGGSNGGEIGAWYSNDHPWKNEWKKRRERKEEFIPSAVMVEGKLEYQATAVTTTEWITLKQKLELLESLVKDLKRYDSAIDKLAVCENHPLVRKFFATRDGATVHRCIGLMPSEYGFIICCIIAIGQEHVLMGLSEHDSALEGLMALAEKLIHVEEFYDNIGGLAGYQLECIKILLGNSFSSGDMNGDSSYSKYSDDSNDINKDVEYLVPPGLDLEDQKSRDHVTAAVMQGIRGLPSMAEIYPLGGAGDRLGLQCENTGDCLPTAVLEYCGRSLLECLVRDVQAREYLHYHIYGKQCLTPIAVMTSAAKGNHWRVVELFEQNDWFGRGRNSFMLFQQPLVPVVGAEDGQWLLPEILSPEMKPGGHGVIWKLMLDAGVFQWLNKLGRSGAIIRQISNPMAGQDQTLLALSGEGLSGPRAFGFASCERVVGAAEGMNVLLRETLDSSQQSHQTPEGMQKTYSYRITNLEYTEFERLGIKDQPAKEGSNYSLFPANTNVLFVGLKPVEKALHIGIASGSASAVLPGLILNTKKEIKYTDALTGMKRAVHAGRLECTMQNLADSFSTISEQVVSVNEDSKHCIVQNNWNDDADKNLKAGERSGSVSDESCDDLLASLRTFLVYGPRRKVTSSAKRQRAPGSKKIHQTPDGSFYDLMCNAKDMLEKCKMDMPSVGDVETYLSQGPGFIFLFHPGLGPLWSIIAQKIRGGRMAKGSELQLEVAEVDIENLDIDGSLRVISENPLGHMKKGEAENDAKLEYSDDCGRIRLHNVQVRNDGIDWKDGKNIYWRHRISRKESCEIHLKGASQFIARDVNLEGGMRFEVPDGHVMYVEPGMKERAPLVTLKPIDGPLWKWHYEIDENTPKCVQLKMEEVLD